MLEPPPMAPTSVRVRIRSVMAAVFGVADDAITDASTPETTAGWDSMNHLHLIVALDAEFGVSLDPDRALGLTSVAKIEAELAALGVAGADAH